MLTGKELNFEGLEMQKMKKKWLIFGITVCEISRVEISKKKK